MKNLTRVYVIALTIIAVVVGISQYLVQTSIIRNSADSRIINISGRQRMLSQKISKASLALVASATQKDLESNREELKSAFELLETSHKALQFGDEELGLAAVNNSEGIEKLFKEVQPKFETIKSAVEGLLAVALPELNSQASQSNLAKILANEGNFLKLMNDITFEYDNEAKGRIDSLSTTEYILFAVAIGLLLLEAIFVFRPAIRRVNESNQKVLEYEKKQKEEALSDKKYLTNQAEIIFSNVKQGIFLLDEELVIDSFYSAETESIFDEDTIAKTNFLRLMKNRLMPRDLEALELFVENLFNPDIREDVVNRLNPVTQVEIFNDVSNSEIENRYIGFTFSRIIRDGKIYRILVTVLDETENVLMQRKIEEAEERNKKESEQLLAVLKVKPKVLKEYLDTTIQSLNSISTKYESSKNTSFDGLISYTFNTIHNAKGNASLINLRLIEEKLHKVENSVTTLRSQEVIEGKNFLKILYEVTEVNSILINMNGMLSSIANAYEQFAKENEETNTNVILISTLTKGIERLSKEQQKQVDFSFEDNGVAIPEEYRLDIKDAAIQLARNSIIHGIENADDRQFAGKSESALINISLVNEGDDQLVFTYQDDGKGLDIEQISEKAIQSNLVTPEELDKMSDQEKVELIFKEGLSTAGQVDKNAGRGQGMSIIESIVNKHGGSYKVHSEAGNLFRITLNLPLLVKEPLTEEVA